MKTTKEGKLKLSQVDRQVANFVFSNYSESVAVQDISSTVILKLSKRLPVARLVEQAIEADNTAFLHNFATMAYFVNGIVPDNQFWEEMNGCMLSCIERHPELYGQKKEMDDAADAAVIQEEKESYEALHQLMKGETQSVS